MSERPFLQVIKGDATPEEVAALIAVVSARATAPAAAPARRGSVWTDRSRLVRGPVQAGPGAWRASALPR
ncbi:acyl-CoA carboxylase epsilon subunit-like protein [Actinocorallia herbida]|uniref:Acyl-CoA carboxylase epsilon subunit-like protein n=1 Tax=Actinocorallia herbida TaxID=58109 RepID=A0A3N1D978_9ACTN|nr:acyl-CoA carboxylase subunit epsilon [Actinocorallia herbida]ROO90092.1 acyl-CoA carboxylase epsilon subunit-like protein [Actinocorallia herbida]